MSTIKVNSIKNTATNDGGIAIDNSGHVQIDGQQLPSAGALSNRNLIINGAMQVAQRGTAFSGNVYTLDRFKAGNNPTDVSQNTSDVPSGFQYSMNLTGSNHLINYRMESRDSFKLSGETVTLSFYAKNISGTNTLKVQLGHPSATDNFDTQTVLQTSSSITLTSSWARYEVTFSSLSSEIQKGLFFFIFREGSTSTDQTRITGVQLEVGVATPFEHRSFADELLKCQRYYQKSYNIDTSPGATTNVGSLIWQSNGSSGAIASNPVVLPTRMRAAPDVDVYSPETGAEGNFRRLTSTAADQTGQAYVIGEAGFSLRTTGTATTNTRYNAHYTADSEL